MNGVWLMIASDRSSIPHGSMHDFDLTPLRLTAKYTRGGRVVVCTDCTSSVVE